MSNLINTEAGVRGMYRVRVGTYSDAGDFVAREDTGWFDNLITNSGLDRMGTSAGYFSRCYVGTDSTEPTFSDSDLGARIAQTGSTVSNNTGVQGDAEPYYHWNVRVFEFAEGVAEGNIAEVGTGWDIDPADGIFSRALVRDSEGNPTTITVLSNEILQVTFQFRLYPDPTDSTGIITLDGVDYNYTMRPHMATTSNTRIGWSTGVSADYRGAFAPNTRIAEDDTLLPYDSGTGVPGDDNFDTLFAAGSYTEGSNHRDCLATADLDTANFATGIGSVSFRFGWGSWMVAFSPKIPKGETETLSLTFRHSWARR